MRPQTTRGHTSVFVGVAIMALTVDAQARQNLWLYRMDAKLQQIGAKSWAVPEGAVLAPLFVMPGGEIVALVQPPTPAPLLLIRWSTEGKELLRRPLPAREAFDVTATADRNLVIVTGSELLRVSTADGEAVARRSLPFPAKPASTVKASVGGAWFAFSDRLVHVRFDAQDTTLTFPLTKLPGGELRARRPLPEGRGRARDPCPHRRRMSRDRVRDSRIQGEGDILARHRDRDGPDIGGSHGQATGADPDRKSDQ